MTDHNESKIEISEELLKQAAGGTVNKNPSPKNTTSTIDETINGPTYDKIAQKVADWLNGDTERKRPVNNDVDINDYRIKPKKSQSWGGTISTTITPDPF